MATAGVDLERIVHTACEFAVRVQMSGGYTERVRASTEHVAVAMGADRAECSVSSTSVTVTAHVGGHSHTAVRHAPAVGVNFSELSELARLARESDTLSADAVEARLEAIEARHRRYPAWLMLGMLGVACASLAMLFGSDPVGAVVAGAGGAAGASVRYAMTRYGFVPFVFTFVAAFVSVAIVMLLQRFSGTPSAVLAASVLYLVPGVPLLNGTADLVTGNYLNGVVRLTMGSVVLLAVALGTTVALALGRLA